jgi:hypothetical protein
MYLPDGRFKTLDAQHVELANQVGEDDCAVAGHVRWLFVLHCEFAPRIGKFFGQLVDFGRVQGQD